MYAKLRTVATSNNRDHVPWSLFAHASRYVQSFASWYWQSLHATFTLSGSLFYCLLAPHIYGCYSSRTLFSWWISHSARHQWRGCNSTKYLGEILDDKLSWSQDITNLEDKLVQSLGTFYIIRHYLTSGLKSVYFCLVYSHNQDAIGAWGSVPKTAQNHLTLWERAYDIFVPRFRPKNSSFWLPYQRHSSTADCAKELFSGSNGLASLLDCTRKKFFGWGLRIFCEWCHKWSSFGVILAHVAWPRAQPLGQSISLKFSLETRLESRSFEPLIDFLALLVQSYDLK